MVLTPEKSAQALPWAAARRTIAYVVLVLAIFGAIVLPRAATTVLPLNADNGLYIAAGKVLKQGGVVGRDTWDNKPPGTYYVYAGLLAVTPDYSVDCTLSGRPLPASGVPVSCAQIVLSIFDSLYAFAIVAAVWWIGRRLFGAGSGALAALLCAIFVSMLNLMRGGGLPDFHALLPSTLGYAAALRYAETGRVRWLVLAGALLGVACLFKQTGLVLFAGIGVWLIVRSMHESRNGWQCVLRRGGLLGAGFVSVLGLSAAILAVIGALPDVINQAILFNRYYVGSPGNVNNLLSQARTQTWNVFVDSQSGLWLAALGALPLLPIAVARDRRVWLVIAWVAASTASLLLGGAHLLVYYYLVLVPPLAVCGGWALTNIWRRSSNLARVWLAVTAATLLAYGSHFQVAEYERAWYSRLQSTTHVPEEFVAGLIRGGQGSLFVWGNGSQVYALSGRQPASRYLHTLALSNDFAVHDQVATNRAELMATLAAAPPAVIAIDTPWLKRVHTLEFPELQQLLASDYELSNSPTNPIFEGWLIYHHR
jgi:Dolichyl-phosphate-mannose-protein mannosyltransferase